MITRGICHAAAALLGVIILTVTGCSSPAPRIWNGCQVTDKDRAAGGSGSEQSDMRVYTANCGTFKVADTWDRSDSSDVFGRIIVGKTFDIYAVGHRDSRWSEFPNIMSVVEVKEPATTQAPR